MEINRITMALRNAPGPAEEDCEPRPCKKLCTSESAIVPHPSMTMALEALRINEHTFAFVFGEFGQGKSELVRAFANECRYAGVVPVHLDSSVDFSSLQGAYACTQRTGVFEYREGPVLHAAREGLLLILDNVQEASEDVLLALSTLSKERSLKSQG